MSPPSLCPLAVRPPVGGHRADSFAGTSLQMIADDIGFTKAAIYHHFPIREQTLLAVLEPQQTIKSS
jgi:Bacterial regulatory proteins, tetR family